VQRACQFSMEAVSQVRDSPWPKRPRPDEPEARVPLAKAAIFRDDGLTPPVSN